MGAYMLVYFVIFTVLFFIVVEILTVLFRMTGLSGEKARFQVMSLLTGTGFTTRESELIVKHPTRRTLAQIVMILGYLGSATFISFIINIITSNFKIKDLVAIGFVFVAVMALLKNPWLLSKFDAVIEKIILKNNWVKISRTKVYQLLNKNKGYGIYHVVIERDSFLIDKTLLTSGLKEKYNIIVLNIDKGDTLINLPDANYRLEQGDNMLIYGKSESIVDLINVIRKKDE